MTWFNDILAKYPGITLLADKPNSANINDHPRDAVLELIKNSIAVLHNPEHTVTKRDKTYKPEVCFKDSKTTPGMVVVALTYCRDALTLHAGNKAVGIEKDKLEPLLLDLEAAVKAKAFDDQLEHIKTTRVAQLKATKGNKAA